MKSLKLKALAATVKLGVTTKRRSKIDKISQLGRTKLKRDIEKIKCENYRYKIESQENQMIQHANAGTSSRDIKMKLPNEIPLMKEIHKTEITIKYI